jgi:hypothetical protein
VLKNATQIPAVHVPAADRPRSAAPMSAAAYGTTVPFAVQLTGNSATPGSPPREAPV